MQAVHFLGFSSHQPRRRPLEQTTVDVAKMTCEQLVLLQVADPDHLAMWLSGYYNGKQPVSLHLGRDKLPTWRHDRCDGQPLGSREPDQSWKNDLAPYT